MAYRAWASGWVRGSAGGGRGYSWHDRRIARNVRLLRASLPLSVGCLVVPRRGAVGHFRALFGGVPSLKHTLAVVYRAVPPPPPLVFCGIELMNSRSSRCLHTIGVYILKGLLRVLMRCRFVTVDVVAGVLLLVAGLRVFGCSLACFHVVCSSLFCV